MRYKQYGGAEYWTPPLSLKCYAAQFNYFHIYHAGPWKFVYAKYSGTGNVETISLATIQACFTDSTPTSFGAFTDTDVTTVFTD